MRAIVFLDRDGTLNQDTGYVHDPDELVLLPGVLRGLQRLASAYRLVVVTNQSGIGRGYYTAEDSAAFNRRLADLAAAAGVSFAGFYACPHRPDEGCACRKPQPGLLEQARAELGAGEGTDWMIGDKQSDVEAGRAAGAQTILIVPGGEMASCGSADHVAVDFDAAAEIVLSVDRRECGLSEECAL